MSFLEPTQDDDELSAYMEDNVTTAERELLTEEKRTQKRVFTMVV